MAKKEQKDILKKIGDLFSEAASYRQKKESGWHENERFYNGDQWRYSKKRPVKNWCFAIVEGELPILTDSRPAPSIVPIDQERADDAKILDSAIQFVLEQQSYQFKVNQVLRKALSVGPAWQFVDYDPEGDNGEGVVTIRNIDWRFVWVDPAANDIDDADYAIVDEPIRVDNLKRMFPGKEKDIKSSKISNNASDDKNHYVDPERWQPDFDSNENTERYAGDSMTSYRKTWIKDYSKEDIPENETSEAIENELGILMNGDSPIIDQYMNHEQHLMALQELVSQFEQQAMIEQEQGMEIAPETELVGVLIEDAIETHKTYIELNPKGKRPKYRNHWRLIITTNNNSLVLYDGAPDVEDGMIPLVPYYCYKGDDVYNMSEIQMIKDAQKSFNDMDWSEYKGLRLNANSGWVKDQDSGVSDSDLTNEEGIVITVNQGKQVRRLEPGTVSPQFQMRKQDDQVSMERISGINESTQGRRPAGITAAQAIKYLQEQSIGRIRLKSRSNEEYSIPRLAMLVGSRVIKYWTSERKLRIYDGDGRLKHIDYSPDEMKTLKYEIKAVPGSTVGLDKESIYTLYMDLLDRGIVDAKTFIQNVDIPYKSKVLEALEERDEAAAQIQQLAMENEQLKAELGIPQENVDQQQVLQ